MIEIEIASSTDEDIVKNLQVHTVRKPCSNAKNIPRKSIDGYAHLKSVADKLHLFGGAVDFLVGTDLVDAFIDIHSLSGDPGEPAASGIVSDGMFWGKWIQVETTCLKSDQ